MSDLWSITGDEAEADIQRSLVEAALIEATPYRSIAASARDINDFGVRATVIDDRLDAAIAKVVDPEDANFGYVKQEVLRDFRLAFNASKVKRESEWERKALLQKQVISTLQRTASAADDALNANGPIRVELVGQDGNAFAIMGRIQRAGRNQGWSAEALDDLFDQMKSGDYNNLLRVAMTYCEDTGSDDEYEYDYYTSSRKIAGLMCDECGWEGDNSDLQSGTCPLCGSKDVYVYQDNYLSAAATRKIAADDWDEVFNWAKNLLGDDLLRILMQNNADMIVEEDPDMWEGQGISSSDRNHLIFSDLQYCYKNGYNSSQVMNYFFDRFDRLGSRRIAVEQGYFSDIVNRPAGKCVICGAPVNQADGLFCQACMNGAIDDDPGEAGEVYASRRTSNSFEKMLAKVASKATLRQIMDIRSQYEKGLR